MKHQQAAGIGREISVHSRYGIETLTEDTEDDIDFQKLLEEIDEFSKSFKPVVQP